MTLETSFYDVRDLTAARDADPRFTSPQRRESELHSVLRIDLSSAIWDLELSRDIVPYSRDSVPGRGTKSFLYQHV
jgi:hypothetical protein